MYIYTINAVLDSLYVSLYVCKSGMKHCLVCLESRLTKKSWINSFTVFKTFAKLFGNFKFREATLIAFVFRDGYKKIKTTSEFPYILKRLSNHLNKLVKSQK